MILDVDTHLSTVIQLHHRSSYGRIILQSIERSLDTAEYRHICLLIVVTAM